MYVHRVFTFSMYNSLHRKWPFENNDAFCPVSKTWLLLHRIIERKYLSVN
jgi:hypothetical protein